MIRLNFDFLKIFCKNIYCQIIYGVENFQLQPCRFLWNKNSDVVFNYESKEKKKNGVCRYGNMGKGKKYRNFDIFKNHNFGGIVQNTWTKGYYCF